MQKTPSVLLWSFLPHIHVMNLHIYPQALIVRAQGYYFWGVDRCQHNDSTLTTNRLFQRYRSNGFSGWARIACSRDSSGSFAPKMGKSTRKMQNASKWAKCLKMGKKYTKNDIPYTVLALPFGSRQKEEYKANGSPPGSKFSRVKKVGSRPTAFTISLGQSSPSSPFLA